MSITGTSAKHEACEMGIRKPESAIVALKRVMTVEQRAGRQIEREKETMHEAKRFYSVLPKRLNRFGLERHKDKSQLIAVGHVAAMRANQRGEHLRTFNFLSFTCYWGTTRNGYWRLKFTSQKDRFAGKLKGLGDFLWKNLSANRRQTLNTVIRVVRGWINYHGISDNKRRVGQFIYQSKRIIYRWFNRKGDHRPIMWGKLNLILKMLGYPSLWKTRSMFQSRWICVGTLVCREPDAVVPQVRF